MRESTLAPALALRTARRVHYRARRSQERPTRSRRRTRPGGSAKDSPVPRAAKRCASGEWLRAGESWLLCLERDDCNIYPERRPYCAHVLRIRYPLTEEVVEDHVPDSHRLVKAV